MSDQPFWGFGGNGLAVLGDMRPEQGKICAVFYPGLKLRAIKSATPLEFLGRLICKSFLFFKEYIAN